MAFFSFLFKKKNETDTKVKELHTDSLMKKELTKNKRGIADPNGLYPSDLILLSLANKYKVNETDYPRYLTYECGIANPNVALKELEKNGFLRRSSAIESLQNLKLADLKEIANATGTVSKKTKSALIENLSILDESTLETYVKDKYWVVTEAGETALNYNRYIQYFLDRHQYSLEEIGIDIWDVNKAVNEHPESRYRDIIWHLMNNEENKVSIEIQTQKYTGDVATHKYCEIYRTMSLFLEEEKNYTNAADYYFKYLYKWVNIHRGMNFLLQYSLKNNKEGKEKALCQFYEDAQLYPYQKTDILRFKEELELNDEQLRKAMRTGFERSHDSGIFTYDEFTDYIFLELVGETEKSEAMCIRIAKEAAKKVGMK